MDLGSGMSVSLAAGTRPASVLEDRLRVALTSVGAAARGRGVAFLFDEAHTMFDQPRKGQFPLGALLSAFVAAQDEDDEPLPVMLVLCGLPPLIANIHRARSNAERLFKAEQIANLGLAGDDALSDAALALVNPAHDSAEISFTDATAERIARDVDGYPYFIQWFGEALWDAADVDGRGVIDDELYATHRQIVRARSTTSSSSRATATPARPTRARCASPRRSAASASRRTRSTPRPRSPRGPSPRA